MLAGLILGIILVMRLFPDTPLARSLHDGLVVQPLRWLAAAERHHIVFVVVVAVILLSPETIAFAGVPHLLVAFAWDASLYIDALVVTSAIAALSSIRMAWGPVRQRLSARLRRIARPARAMSRQRARRTRKPAKPARNDEDGLPVFALAA